MQHDTPDGSVAHANVPVDDITLSAPQLSFDNLELTVGTKKILAGVTGVIKPCTLTAVMGPSGCGKTSFLSVLSGKVANGSVSGKILINDEHVPIKTRAVTGYVPQEDVMHRSLRVREVLFYQISLRCPASWTHLQRLVQLERTIHILELNSIRDTRIGDEETRGISGGQRKRVNIGMELVADPTLLFLDEPTSGLDSSSSLDVVRLLKKLSKKGMTVIVVLHQPRYEIFEAFDQVLFLGKSYLPGSGGRTVYFDATKNALPYFTEYLGYSIDEHANPADFIIDIIGHAQKLSERHSRDFDTEECPPCPADYRKRGILEAPLATEELFLRWTSHASKHGLAVSAELSSSLSDGSMSASLIAGDSTKLKGWAAIESFGWQCWVFFKRCMVLMRRIKRSLFFDIGLVVFGAFFLGAIYIDVSLEKIPGMMTLSSLVIGLTTMLSSLRIFGTDRAVFWRESSAGVNRVAYFVAANLAHLPVLFLTALFYVCVLHTLLSPRTSFLDHWLVVLLVVWATSGIGYLFSCALNPRNTQMASVVFVLISSMLSGSSPTLTKLYDLGFLGRALAAISFSRWMVEALFNREAATYPEVFAAMVLGLQQTFGYNTDNSFYAACCGILLSFGFIARSLALTALLLVNRDKQR